MKFTGSLTLFVAVLMTANIACAQTAPAQAPAAVAIPGMSIKAFHSQWQGNTLRLDGSVRIVSPGELDVAADAIALDMGDRKLNQVRALGNVRLKVDLPSRNGGAPVHIESTSKSATLDPRTKVLTLSGTVAGWYQPKGGSRVSLGGETVAVSFDKANASMQMDNGAIAVPVPDEGALAGIGIVTVRANKTTLNEKAESTFTGGARAFSNGARKFDLTADNFVMSRAADGTLQTMKTSGRTTLVTDLPAGTPDAGSVGTPVRLEVTSDSATVKQADNTLVFEGHVKGFYVLQNAAGERSSFPFTGDRALLTLIPATATTKADFILDFNGVPTTSALPRFDLGL